MKKVFLFTLLLVLCLAQSEDTYPRPRVTYQPDRPTTDPNWKPNTEVPTQAPQTERPKPNEAAPTNDRKMDEKKMQGHKREDKNQRYNGPNTYQPNYNPEGQYEEMPDEVVAILLFFYGIAVLCFLSVCSCMTYFCVKKSQERKKTKARMQELQMMFAQSQNMNVFQMNAQPHFPKTIHI